MCEQILLEKLYSDVLNFRTDAELIFDSLDSYQKDKFIFDFENVSFISRSFAQEYLSQKLRSPYEIKEINKGFDVCAMFDLVKKDDINLKKAKEEL